MHDEDEEYIAYRPDKYTQVNGDKFPIEDEDELTIEKTLSTLKWNQFMYDQNSIGSDVSFKRVKRDDEEAPEPPPSEEGGGEGGGGGGEGGGSVGGGSDGAEKTVAKEPKLFLTPIIAITAFFALIFILGPLMVRKGPNRGIVQSSIMLAAFCMWIFWVTVYIGQMNPLMGPRLENTTVAWLALKVGNPVKPPESAAGGE